MYDVVALGELLIDFTSSGISDQGNALFEANPGGAPCNVLAMLAKWGKKTGFIGKVGQDMFGDLLRQTIREVGIDDCGLVQSDAVNTTLAFVQTDAGGEREFSFYRKPGADMMLQTEEICRDMLEQTKIFHFGTLSMTHPAVREATRQAVRWAKAAGAKISFDPNLRPPLWDSLELAREQMLSGCGWCDILKVEEEELKFMTGMPTMKDGVDFLRRYFSIELILVTKGAEGSCAFYHGFKKEQKAFWLPDTVDTTGAGDTFLGCCLAYVLDHGLQELTAENLQEMLAFASGAAAIVTTRKGAIRSMPDIDQVYELLAAHQTDRSVR